MRRIHASCEEANLPRLAGIVRVARFPIWWQPTHAMFFIHIAYSLRLPGIFATSSADGSFIIEYQYAAGYDCAALASSFAAVTLMSTLCPRVAAVFAESARP